MKNFKIAALPLAIAGLALSNQAFAGTQACFEIFKGADNAAVTDAVFDTVYTNASCIAEANRGGATGVDLQPTLEARIAYELTKDYDIDFDTTDGVNTDTHIVYIPTTDIPSGTLISMTLSGATFKGNNDIIHLVQDNDLGNLGNTAFDAVASTDGAVDGENTITFLTKAGVTITAGTRLVLSKLASGADASELVPVSINIKNTECADPTTQKYVTLQATSAKTDGGNGYNIQGGVSAIQNVADISPQFVTFYNNSNIDDAQVNAESSNNNGGAITARTQFVYDATVTAGDKLTRNAYQVINKAVFINKKDELDDNFALDADDVLETKFVTTSDAGATVFAGIYDTQDKGGNGALTNGIDVDSDGTSLFAVLSTDYGTAPVSDTSAQALFADLSNDTGAEEAAAQTALTGTSVTDIYTNDANYDYNETYYVLENTVPASATEYGVMNFNYMHTPEHTLKFNDANLLDHCAQKPTLHEVGVNGAVLKVPYTYDNGNTWVRITNEHNEEAEITLDIFDENSNQKNSVNVGKVAEHASVVLYADELIEKAKAAGYMGTGTRHTMTFTVTAPSNTVHGVSVQKIPGGVDRVLPVLDQNDWTQ
ncbi:hypothetical protein [Thalassotalea profundi]|uniref:Uncharacterized protein n=1 Tax=Thalassotalea profundi TaxID=2036687 RepID=A0ABQ3IF23_9GAMM|nr:hypothetical protein [Thalassotalea profundi]GHE80668.1 hypothetical protein GCM10011501_05790 [Thalassotalea profundi]